MKKTTILFKTIIFLVLTFITISSCIKEKYDKPILNNDGSIPFICEGNEPKTKTTLNGLTTSWIANSDKVGLFSPQATTVAGGAAGVINIPLTALNNGERSQFSGTVFWGSGEHDFYSYYPYTAGSPEYTAVPVSLPADQSQLNGDNSDHLGSLDFLIAKPYKAKFPGNYSDGATVSLKYSHLFAILEFQIIRSSGTDAISKVKLIGKVPLAFGSGTIDLSQSTPASGVSYVIDGMSNTSNSVTVSLGTAITPTTDYSTTPKVYMVVLPGTHVGDLKIGVESAGVFKEVKKTDATFERGKKYIVKVDADMASIPVITGSELEPVTIDGTTWMPVNAGYSQDLTKGEYFQWFRKYGFGQQPEIMLANETLWNDDLDQETSMEKYKNVFFTSKGSSYEWMPCYQTAWNLTEKFNPCPAGWRLPTKDEATTLISYGSTSITTENAGGVDGLVGRWIGPNHDNPDLRTSTAVFFPYTGMISYSNGLLPSSFSVGYYWLAYYGEPSTTYNGQMMSVNQNQSTNPSTSLLNKAYGLSVRCVKKETSVETLLYTTKPTDVQEGLVTTGGYVEAEGSLPVTERGVFYGNSINPATTKVVAPTAGLGSFALDITGLEELKTYYVRAYAKNSAGTVYYGDQYKFIKKNPDNYNGEEVTISGVTWAPYNAGYSDLYPYGLLYQWHRKYGQTYTGETPAPTFSSSATTLSTASGFINKNRFYYKTTSPYDCISPQQASWNMDRMYNPCPDGWRVPTDAEFQLLIDSGNSWGTGPGGIPGIWFGENHSGSKEGCVFLPASGFRDHTATTNLRDTWGLYWTSSINSISANALIFSSDNTPAISARYRASANSVRCVKE